MIIEDNRMRQTEKAPSEPATLERPPAPSIGPLTALRLPTGEFAVARRVDLGDRVLVQGALLDWPALRAALLAQVADLVPDASLDPSEDEGEPLRLASLPVRLVPPADAAPASAEHPATPGLLLVWLAAIGAIGATGLALRASIGAAARTSRFASSVTHELRTPLTTFRLYSEMLADGMVADRERARSYLATLRDDSARLGLLVENVLAWSRAENGRAPAEPRATTVGALLAEIEPLLRRRAEEAGGAFEVVDRTGEGARIETDSARVRQILFSLVDNAAKYAVKEQETSSAIRLVAARRGDRLVLSVEDDGPGVPAPIRRRIFRAFDRGVRGPGDAVRGLGLGLAISSELARGLGGRLRCVDAAAGARFELELPSRLMKNSIRAADGPEEPSAASPRLAVFGEYGSAASPSFIWLGICPLGIALATKRVLHQPASACSRAPASSP